MREIGPKEAITFSRSKELGLAEKRLLLEQVRELVTGGKRGRVDVHQNVLDEIDNAQRRKEAAELGDQDGEDNELARLLVIEALRIGLGTREADTRETASEQDPKYLRELREPLLQTIIVLNESKSGALVVLKVLDIRKS